MSKGESDQYFCMLGQGCFDPRPGAMVRVGHHPEYTDDFDYRGTTNILWQRCPVCNGSGKDPYPPALSTNAVSPTCPTCNGARILSILNGKPPHV